MIDSHHRSAVVCAVMVLLGAVFSARADRLPLPDELQVRVNKAIDDGVKYLRFTQTPRGTWTKEKEKHVVGYAALPGLTLLECGLPASDRGVQVAAYFVRQNSGKLQGTYEVALAILFLDRLGDKRDRGLIEMLALRLIAGQTPTGGWSYKCPLLSAQQHQDLLKALRARKPTAAPAYLAHLPVLQEPARLTMQDPKDKGQEPTYGTTDNSNSQFAMLGLWVARRHNVPVMRSLNLIVKRFHTSQNPDGGWGYRYKSGGGESGSASMTCVGLLGLAIGHGLAHEETLKGKPAPGSSFLRAVAAARQTNALNLALIAPTAHLEWLTHYRPNRQPPDPRILMGFVALDKHVGAARGRWQDLPMHNLYFLWSVERVAVLYDLDKLGAKNWYQWGAEILVANQKSDGHWEGGGYHGASATVDTCLALLFLKRANLTTDLATRLPFDPLLLTEEVNKKLLPPVAVKPPVPPIVVGPPGSLPNPLGEDPKLKNVVQGEDPNLAKGMPVEEPEPKQGLRKNGGELPAPVGATEEEDGKKPVWATVLIIGGGSLLFLLLLLLVLLLLLRRRKDEERRTKKRKRTRTAEVATSAKTSSVTNHRRRERHT
jgi:hypothetical protein